MKESRAQSVTLQDDDARIVRLMLDYFYDFDYQTDAYSNGGMSDLELHASVYAIAEKYEAMDLKALAAKKFARGATSTTTTPHNDILQAIPLVYNLTPRTDRGLREVVIGLWLIVASEVVAQKREEVEAVMREAPEFAMDVSMRLAPLCGKGEMSGRCHCGRQVYGRGRHIFTTICVSCRRSANEVKELSVCADVKLKPFW